MPAEVCYTDGTKVKVGDTVTPTQTKCYYYGQYTMGDVGTVKAVQVSGVWETAPYVGVVFQKKGSWKCHPKEIKKVSLREVRKEYKFFPGDIVMIKDYTKVPESYFPEKKGYYKVSSSKPDKKVAVITTKEGSYFSIEWANVKRIPTPKFKSAPPVPATVGKEYFCSSCSQPGKMFTSVSGHLFCKKCYNRVSICTKCGEITPAGYMAGSICFDCYAPNLHPEFSGTAKKFGLRPKIKLCREASDFYLLTLDSLIKGEKTMDLIKKTNVLADDFSLYMFLAIGGELRHVDSTSILFAPEKREARWKEQGVPQKFIKWLGERAKPDAPERDTMWEEWLEVSKTYGKANMAHWAEVLFDTEYIGWTSFVGGHKWALIAKVLHQYLSGGINKTVFVDTAFGLKHNGAPQFTKAWDIAYLKYILDCNQCSYYKPLYALASPEVRKIIDKNTEVKCLIKQ